jgi:hypothetical protein
MVADDGVLFLSGDKPYRNVLLSVEVEKGRIGASHFGVLFGVSPPRRLVLFATSRSARPKSAFSRIKYVAEVPRRGGDGLSQA